MIDIKSFVYDSISDYISDNDLEFDIYFVYAPKNGVIPCITYNEISNSDVYRLTGNEVAEIGFQFNFYAMNMQDMTLMEQVIDEVMGNVLGFNKATTSSYSMENESGLYMRYSTYTAIINDRNKTTHK